MSNIIINTKKSTIEMNKTFSAAASKFGTREYDELQAARRDYPTFRVVTVAKRTAKTEFKGLTYEYMEKYIASHDDEENSKMAEYKMLRGISDEGKDAVADSVDYADIKEWFFMTFPEIENFHSKRDALLEQITKRREARKAA